MDFRQATRSRKDLISFDILRFCLIAFSFCLVASLPCCQVAYFFLLSSLVSPRAKMLAT